MLRKTPLKRGGPIKRNARVNPISDRRSVERKEYAKRRASYLLAHPWDQIKIAFCGFDEAEIIAHAANLPACARFIYHGHLIERADQIHHRLKGYGPRLNDERWWMATARGSHHFVESNKSFARELGFLLPTQADLDGCWGYRNQALTTPELMKARAAR